MMIEIGLSLVALALAFGLGFWCRSSLVRLDGPGPVICGECGEALEWSAPHCETCEAADIAATVRAARIIAATGRAPSPLGCPLCGVKQ